MARFTEVVRLVAKSPTASYWQKQFIEWITAEPDLATSGAKGLVELCALTDPCVASLVTRVAQEPTNASLDALEELIGGHRHSPHFVADTLTLLRTFADTVETYGLLEKAILFALTRAVSDGLHGPANHEAMLQALEHCARQLDLPPALGATLARARQAMQSAIEENLLRGAEAHSGPG
jgi:hypothetical protein